jgi:predicted PolB exonuclease-like 3'-5' exonuclease
MIYQEVQSKSMFHNPSNTAFSKKRKFDELTDENDLSEDQDFDKSIERQEQAYQQSMDSVENFKKERAKKGMKMDWKLCLVEGKKRFDWKYKNTESLRVQFSKHKKDNISMF